MVAADEGRHRIGLQLFEYPGHGFVPSWLIAWAGHDVSRGPWWWVRGSLVALRGHQKTVDPIWPTARGSSVGGTAASVLPRPGHRSPVDSAAEWRGHAHDESADPEIHYLLVRPHCWWFDPPGGTLRRIRHGGPPRESTASLARPSRFAAFSASPATGRAPTSGVTAIHSPLVGEARGCEMRMVIALRGSGERSGLVRTPFAPRGRRGADVRALL